VQRLLKLLLPFLLFNSLLFISLLSNLAYAGGLQFHWEDDFNPEERQRLRQWIEQTDAALTSLVGDLPLTRHIYLHRRDNSREPVPWAHTQRGSEQGVHFHVDPRFPQSAFLEDWTAPHELSHLIIPYLGEGYSWFAEGFASYMQYQVMGAMGVIEPDEIDRRYADRFQRAERKFGAAGGSYTDMPFAKAAPKLRAARQYPTMYWGGAVYFWQVDQWLQQHAGTTLTNALQSYVDCCRNNPARINELMSILDGLVENTVFSHCMTVLRQKPGFPEFRDGLELLPAAR
jgi:hypothetical protein